MSVSALHPRVPLHSDPWGSVVQGRMTLWEGTNSQLGAGVVGRSVVRLECFEEARKLLSLLITSVLEHCKEK